VNPLSKTQRESAARYSKKFYDMLVGAEDEYTVQADELAEVAFLLELAGREDE